LAGGSEKKVKNKNLGEMIGQMIMVGFREAEVTAETSIIRAIKEFSLGGVILYNIDLPCFWEAKCQKPDLSREEGALICPRNIISKEQLRKLTSALSKLAKSPLLIAVDQEGGLVSRLSPAAGFPPRESPKELGQKNNLAYTEQVAKEIARDLKDSGINLNLAPVVDLDLNPQGLISTSGRSFGPDPELVYRHSRAFILAHRQQGILTCLKHFPGKGSAGGDTHFEVIDVTQNYRAEELWPFQKLIAEGLADLIMTSHVWHREWDEEFPVTLSAKIIQGLLRGKLGYRGPLITDDLLMGGVSKQFPLEEAVVLAVRAGADILLASNNSPNGYEENLLARIYEALVKALEKRLLSLSMITSAYARIQELKNRVLI